MNEPQSAFDKLVVYCDESNDRLLMQRLQSISAVLSRIPDTQLRLYPQAPVARESTEFRTILPLFECDRPDYIFVYDGVPVLVVEITEHAYTGDNGLQRFVRVAAAAEQRVPFIYFGPLSRSRDDELDRLEEGADPGSLSKRSLTSDFFEGMQAVHERFGSPQLYVQWVTAANGKVRKLSNRPSTKELSEIYGDLVTLIESVLRVSLKTASDADLRRISKYETDLARLAKKRNTLNSDVKLTLSAQEVVQLFNDPATLLLRLPGYFLKGKADKLLALHAINSMRIRAIRAGSTILTDPKRVASVVQLLANDALFANGAIGYYTGYKWRSDPHSGVAINTYYRLCETSKARRKPLIIFYPRVSISDERTDELIGDTRVHSSLTELFVTRYGHGGEGKFKRTVSSKELYSTWDPTTKQGRIFERYSAIVFCSDGLVLGGSLAHLLK